MDPALSSWKYESGFLTIFHAGKSYELGYFKLHEDARNAVLAFRETRRSIVSRPRCVARGLLSASGNRSKTAPSFPLSYFQRACIASRRSGDSLIEYRP
jgi:hypothetical protein